MKVFGDFLPLTKSSLLVQQSFSVDGRHWAAHDMPKPSKCAIYPKAVSGLCWVFAAAFAREHLS